jgi:His/Glu/Gln/Arg/opine family amino acid ABC transporter permease subunit
MNFAPFVSAFGTTLQVAFGAWIVATIVGLVIAALRELEIPLVDRILGFIVTLVRALPELVLLYIVFFGIAYVGIRFDAIPAAIIALGISEGAFVSEYFRGAILTVTARQRAAAASLGMSTMQTFRFIVLPQAVPVSIPPLVNAFVGLLKMATLAAAVGAPELLYVAREQMALTGDVLQIALLIVIVYVVITIPLTLAASELENRVRKRLAA